MPHPFVIEGHYLVTCIVAANRRGGRGIRTPGPLSGTLVFKTSSLGHSDSPPFPRYSALGGGVYAEPTGFEPAVDFSTHVFETCAISLSTTVPYCALDRAVFDVPLLLFRNLDSALILPMIYRLSLHNAESGRFELPRAFAQRTFQARAIGH